MCGKNVQQLKASKWLKYLSMYLYNNCGSYQAEQEIEECSFKSPQGEEFKYSRDMNLQKGRITCLCKVSQMGTKFTSINNIFQTEKYKLRYACGILVKNITDLDFGNWR